MGPFDENWLFAAVLLSAPLVYAAMGELISERTGVLNIGLEGMMLTGAFTGYIVAWQSGSAWLGALGGVAGGTTLGVLMALLSIDARANQIVVGVGLNILALGATSYAFGEVFPGGQAEQIARPNTLSIPLLSALPVVGRPLFEQTLFVYGAFMAAAVVWLVLYRSPFGLSARAAGDVPAALDTAGVSVRRTRWLGVLIAGAMAGLGGAFLAVGQIGLFADQMTAGRGFLAFAAVIFGRWRPAGVLAGCVIFGAGDALQLRLQAEATIPSQVWAVAAIVAAVYLVRAVGLRARGATTWLSVAVGVALTASMLVLFTADPSWALPSQFWLALPFVLTLLALGGFVGRARAPAALAIPYDRAAV